jgi:hypothetical protein
MCSGMFIIIMIGIAIMIGVLVSIVFGVVVVVVSIAGRWWRRRRCPGVGQRRGVARHHLFIVIGRYANRKSQ